MNKSTNLPADFEARLDALISELYDETYEFNRIVNATFFKMQQAYTHLAMARELLK
jgi:hypothetical protein